MQISLDLRNENLSEKRIHQICAWKPARCRSGERSLAPRNWRRLRGPPRAADRRFLPFWLLSHCYFLLPIGDDSRSL